MRARSARRPSREGRTGFMKTFASILFIALAGASSLADPGAWPMLARDAVALGPRRCIARLAHDARVDRLRRRERKHDRVRRAERARRPSGSCLRAGRIGRNHSRLRLRPRRRESVRFSAPVDTPALDSWSTPLIDESNERLIVASGETVTAFEAETGVPAWSATLEMDVVNASPLVTSDLGPADRLFLTDADGFLTQGGGNLYCINIDPRDAQTNPFDPGRDRLARPAQRGQLGQLPRVRRRHRVRRRQRGPELRRPRRGSRVRRDRDRRRLTRSGRSRT